MHRRLAPFLLTLALVALIASPAILPSSFHASPASQLAGREDLAAAYDELSPAQEQAIWDEIQRSLAMLRHTGQLPQLAGTQAVAYGFPLRLAPGHPDYAGFRVSAFADHNPSSGAVLDYNGGTRTYDGHRGTDYALWPFSWNKLDAGEVEVIAAAAGTIVSNSNVDPSDHNCGSSSSDPWNYVALVHADGRMTLYGHMRYNSLTTKGVGQSVAQGEYLGTVASSGNSSGPHLHFEVRFGNYSSAEWIDPYAGPASQAESLWATQRPYRDSAINKLSTHSAPPSTPNICQPSITNLQDSFSPPARIYFYAYYRDYQSSLATQLRLYRPDASLHSSWQYAPAGSAFYSTWSQGWVVDLSASDPAGLWRFEAIYNGSSYQTFVVLNGKLAAFDDSAMTTLNVPVTIDALGNDQGPDSDQLVLVGTGQPGSGTASVVGTSIVYTPTLDFLGTDVFTYTVKTSSEQAAATVTVRVVSQISRIALPLIQG